jgi:hypothetical protein
VLPSIHSEWSRRRWVRRFAGAPASNARVGLMPSVAVTSAAEPPAGPYNRNVTRVRKHRVCRQPGQAPEERATRFRCDCGCATGQSSIADVDLKFGLQSRPFSGSRKAFDTPAARRCRRSPFPVGPY